MIKRSFVIVNLAFLVVLAGCVQGPSPLGDPSISAIGTAHPSGFDHTLLASYEKITLDGEGNRDRGYSGITYRPRQATASAYRTWDLLELPSEFAELELVLNRTARLAVLLDDGAAAAPAWLSSWTPGPTVDGRPSWTREFGRGAVTLQGAGAGQGYDLLLAEAGGTPSAQPPLPAGIGEAQRPVANRDCPSWVHDLYQAEGPDGKLYQSWHPQIDPVYWCYFGHEHGSDPRLVGYDAAFRYVADRNRLQQEQHEGFKGFAYRDEDAGVGVYINVHVTTSALSRVCAQRHTVVIAVTDLDSGELLAEFGFKSDFGGLETTERDNGGEGSRVPITPAACPSVNDVVSDGIKRVRVHNVDGIGRGGYEQWDGMIPERLVASVRNPAVTFDIQNPMTACDTLDCVGAIDAGGDSTKRSFRLRNFTVDSAVASGEFYTDVYGSRIVSPGPNAIRQYIKPGTRIEIRGGGFGPQDPWRGLLLGGEGAHNQELEGSLRSN